jgi:hypothetical protein
LPAVSHKVVHHHSASTAKMGSWQREADGIIQRPTSL